MRYSITILLLYLIPTIYAVEPPKLASRPNAKISLYLDFDGHSQATWGQYSKIATVPFAMDTERNTFNAINEIWERISDDYCPFNVNVTTIEPADPQQTAHVVIGGSTSAWYGVRDQYGRVSGYQASGVAMQNGFIEHTNHIAFVFPDNLKSFGQTWVKAIAEAASHEAGHLFGCRHIPSRNQYGQVVESYDRGSRRWAPIMGIGFYARRSLWHRASNETGKMQDDIKILTTALGPAPDDHTNEAAYALPIVSNPVEINGIIENSNDVDLFHFNTDNGRAILRLEGYNDGPNLEAELELFNNKGSIGKISTGESLEVDVQSGVYYISIKPSAGYGNLGRYRVTGKLPDTAMQWTLLGR